jgi:hypothetical protein
MNTSTATCARCIYQRVTSGTPRASSVSALTSQCSRVAGRGWAQQGFGSAGAKYYFNGQPGAVFRCRLYSFHRPIATADGESPSHLYDMRLYRFAPEFEVHMKRHGYDLSLLEREAWDPRSSLEELCGCEILWGETPTPAGQGKSFTGIMKHGCCRIKSQRDNSVVLRIEDELVLRANELLINDRGFDAASGRLIYGNRDGVPYQMERVRPGSDLEWTVSGGAPRPPAPT